MKSKFIINILLLLPIFSMVISLLAPYSGAAYAQTAADIVEAMMEDENATFSENPYATDDDGGDQPPRGRRDTTKNKVRKPLESYLFNDSVRARPNFKWNMISGYNEVELVNIDTALADWHIDYPFMKDGVGDMYLGGLGQPTQPIKFADRPDYYDFKFAQPYNAYIFNVDNAPFYNVKRPFTQLQYLESGQSSKRESNFGLTHAQNIRPSTGFALEYKARSTKGLYQQQETRNHNLAFTAYHTGRRYTVEAGFLNNDIRAEENGGIVGTWAVRDSIFELPSGVPTKLGDANAYNRYRNYSAFVQQVYGIPLHSFTDKDFTMANHSAVYIGHAIEYNKWSKVYTDNRVDYINIRSGVDDDGNFIADTTNYYDNWYIDADRSRDSISERRITNKFFVQLQPYDRNGILGLIDAGIGIDMYAYNYFTLDGYLSGDLERTTRSAWYAYGAVEGKIRRYLEWGADAKIYPSGFRAGDMTINGHLLLRARIRRRTLMLSGRVGIDRQSPSFWQENLYSNHYIFDTPLLTENKSSAEIRFTIPEFNLEMQVSGVITDNAIYYDTDSNVAQSTGATTVLSAYIRKMFKLKGLHLDHKLLYQSSTNQVVAAVPKFSASISYYYQFWVVKNVLDMQIGVDARYTTAYYMPSYNPALSTFYNQRDEITGDYPTMDVFIAAKWKRMRILVKYQHLNNNLFGNGENFSVYSYPQNPGMFKFGISWGFYD